MPNPASDFSNVILPGNAEGICMVKIEDITGRLIKKLKFNCNDKRKIISTTELAPGIYNVQVQINAGFIKTVKLIVVR